MNASDTSWAGLLAFWLTDYYLAATLLLLVSLVGWRWIRQPAHRIMAAWIVLLELIVLAVVCAMPFWPRVSLIAAVPREVVAPSSLVDEQPLAAKPPILLTPDAESNQSWGGSYTATPVPGAAVHLPHQRRLTWTELIAVGYLVGAAMSCLWLGWGAVATMWLCKQADAASDALQAELKQVVAKSGTGPFFGGQTYSAGRRPAENMDLSPSASQGGQSHFRGGGVDSHSGDNLAAKIGTVPCLLVSRHVPNAVAVGVLRPTIILPAELAESSSPPALRAVLSHEWAHIRNRDLWLLALGRCLLMVLFAHPLFWWLRRAIRSDQELLADAVAAGDHRQDYAEDLLRLIRKTTHPSPLAVSAAMGIWEGSSQLSRRIAMLLDETFYVEPTGSRRWKFRALGVLVLLGAACSLVTLQPVHSVAEQARPVVAAESEKPHKDETPKENSSLSVRIKATDAKTKEPVKSLTITWASREPREKHLTWQSQYLKRYAGGLGEFHQQNPWPETALRIEADGYLPFVTRPIKRGEGEVALDIALEPDSGLAGTVLTPNGTPANGASVVICTWTNEVTVQRGQLRYVGHGRTFGKLVETAADGSFRLPTEVDPWLLAVAHPSGYAEVTAAEFAKSSLVQLKPWGRIEGQFVLNGKPMPNQTIHVEAGRGDGDVMLHYDDSVTTDAMGKFVVERVPPVRLFVHPNFKKSDFGLDPGWFGRHQVSVTPGETTRITVPRMGQPVTGRVSLPPVSELSMADVSIEANVYLRPPSVSGPEDIVKQQYSAYGAFMKSEYAQAFRRDKIAVNADGTFRIEGLPETDYVLQVRAEKTIPPPLANGGPSRAFGAKRVTVPPLTDSNEPVDLGDVLLRFDAPKQGAPSLSKPETKAGKLPNKPAKPATAVGKDGGERAAESSAGDGQLDLGIQLPGRVLLGHPKIRNQLGISAEQEKRLREISAAYRADSQKFGQQVLKLSPEERERQQTALREKHSQMTKEVRQQVDAVLTPEQLDAYKKLMFQQFASGVLRDPEVLKTIGITPEQKEKLRQLRQMAEQDLAKPIEQSLAVLTPQQREKLRPKAEQKYRESHEPASEGTKATTLRLSNVVEWYSLDSWRAEGVAETDYLILPVYEQLGEPAVRKTLGLSAAQEKQLHDIATKCETEAKKLREQSRKLTPAEQQRKGFQVHQKSMQIAQEVRPQIEALLTPQQLAALKDIVLGPYAVGLLHSAQNQKEIGLSDQQQAALKRIGQDAREKAARFAQEMSEKELGILTPQQQEKLRAEVDRRGW